MITLFCLWFFLRRNETHKVERIWILSPSDFIEKKPFEIPAKGLPEIRNLTCGNDELLLTLNQRRVLVREIRTYETVFVYSVTRYLVYFDTSPAYCARCKFENDLTNPHAILYYISESRFFILRIFNLQQTPTSFTTNNRYACSTKTCVIF